jgi:hypothetical protein
MGVPTSEVGYTSATTERGDHAVHNEHVVAQKITIITQADIFFVDSESVCYAVNCGGKLK